jgi:hypothetical protein
MTRDELFSFVNNSIMDTQEVMDYLGISRQRLYALINSGVLQPLRKGIYLRLDVENRKLEQESLREKYYRPKK